MKKALIALLLLVIFNGLQAQITWMGNEYTTLGSTQYLGDKILFEIQSFPIADQQGAQVYIDWNNDGYGGTFNVDYFALNWIENVGNNSKWNKYVTMMFIGTHNRKYLGWQTGKSDYQTSSMGTFVVSALNNPINQNLNRNPEFQGTKVNVSWNKDAQNHNVMVVRKLSTGSWTEPTQGIAYSVNENLGDGKVVYNGAGTSFVDESLTSGITYDYKFYSENYSYYSEGVTAQITTGSKNTDYFKSKASGNWNSTGTWETSMDNTNWIDATLTPTSSASSTTLLNGHTVTVTSAATANSLTINSGGYLVINSTSSLDLSGTLVNDNGSSGLVIKSDATGTGALLHNTDAVPGTVERYFTGSSNSWHLISSPISGQDISGDFTPSGSGYDFYTWHETSGLWVNKKNTTVSPTWNEANGGTTFVTGRGYMVAYEASNPTKSFAGSSLHNGTVNFSMTISGTGSYAKYNLAGNPYPSPIDWKATSGWTRTNLADNSGYDFSIFNQTANNYGVYNSGNVGDNGTNGVTRYIPVGQGFMVKASAAGNLTMTNDVRVAQNPGFLKSAAEIKDILRLKAISALQGWSDEIIVEFGHASDLGGAAKMFSFDPDAPSLYTVKNDGKYSIDFRGEAGPVSIPVYFTPGTDGDFTLEATQLESFTTGSRIILEDLKENNSIDLTTDPGYSFYSAKSDPAARFILHFGGAFSAGSNATPTAISIFTDGRTVFITTPEGKEITGKIHLFNMMGRQLTTADLKGTTSITLDPGLPTGYYLVRVTTQNITKTQKIWIR